MIRGAQRDIPVVKKTIQASIHNRFDIEVIDSRTGRIKSKAYAENVICDNLYNYLMATAGYFTHIHYGSGSGTPSASDTDLFNKIGHGNAIDVACSAGEKDGVAYLRRKMTISESVAVGANITEVGIAAGTGSGVLCTHAMLKDMNGNIVSLNKTSTDIVNVYATVYVHYSFTGYDNGSIRIHPSLYSGDQGLLMFLAGRYSSVSGNGGYFPKSYCAAIGGYQYNYQAGKAPAHGLTSLSLDAASKTITMTLARISAGYGNCGGIPIVQLMDYWNGSSGANASGSGTSIVLIAGKGSWYPYSQVTGESVGTGDGTTVKFALDFPHAYDAHVYVDGVERDDLEVFDIPNQPLFDQLQWISPYSTVDNLIPKLLYKDAYNTTYVNWDSGGIGKQFYFYNPSYKAGIASIKYSKMKFEMSDDLTNWITIGEGDNSYVELIIPEEYRHYKYGRFTSKNTSSVEIGDFKYPSDFVAKAIEFSNPPAAGSVITADYKTPVIAKDANHVFDLTVTIQLGEYTEAQ